MIAESMINFAELLNVHEFCLVGDNVMPKKGRGGGLSQRLKQEGQWTRNKKNRTKDITCRLKVNGA